MPFSIQKSALLALALSLNLASAAPATPEKFQLGIAHHEIREDNGVSVYDPKDSASLFKRYPPNLCEPSSYIDQTSDGSPWKSDCQEMIDILASREESWTIYSGQRTVAWWKTCAFGAENTTPQDGISGDMGGGDIITVIRDSMARFGGNNRVGALGYFKCGTANLKWGLFTNPWQ